MADPTSGVRARADGARLGMDYTPPNRTAAIKAAGRHSARVRFLKRAIVVGAVLGVSMIGMVAFFNPFRHLPGSVSIAGVGVNGTKITMDSPKIAGVQQGGGLYEIKAKSGVQDITAPSVIELNGINAKVGMADHSTTHILSKTGVYDSKADSMSLKGDVRIANSSGYVFNLQSALMDFKGGVFTSHERLRIDLKGGEVSADDMAISNNGHVIVFRGNIASSFEPPVEEPSSPESAQQASAEPAK